MNNITIFKDKVKLNIPKPKNDIEDDPRYKEYVTKSLEELLDDLIIYGKHHLSWMGDGWYCSLEIYVNVIGAELKVKSEFNNRTHRNAVIQCSIRLHRQSIKLTEQGKPDEHPTTKP